MVNVTSYQVEMHIQVPTRLSRATISQMANDFNKYNGTNRFLGMHDPYSCAHVIWICQTPFPGHTSPWLNLNPWPLTHPIRYGISTELENCGTGVPGRVHVEYFCLPTHMLNILRNPHMNDILWHKAMKPLQRTTLLPSDSSGMRTAARSSQHTSMAYLISAAEPGTITTQLVECD